MTNDERLKRGAQQVRSNEEVKCSLKALVSKTTDMELDIVKFR